MTDMPHNAVQGRISSLELPVCLAFNRANRHPAASTLFSTVSRLGDGYVWYFLAALLVVWHGGSALPTVGRMLLSGVGCVSLYKLLKATTGRPRPFEADSQFYLSIAPLDEYSFPSGHTMHAVAFTVIVVAAYPALACALVPFTALVALSRLVLGLHYPSDVAVGALIGALAGLGVTHL